MSTTSTLLLRSARAAILAYQAFRWQKPSPCRYFPGCSTYALEAIELHGLGHGLLFTVKRLSRCHPFASTWGFDPVPEKVSKAS